MILVAFDKAVVLTVLRQLKTASVLLEDISPFCGATDTPVLDF